MVNYIIVYIFAITRAEGLKDGTDILIRLYLTRFTLIQSPGD